MKEKTIEKENKGPERRCALTGESKVKAELIRFVLSPDDQLVPDLKANLPGRGVWITASKAAILQAVKKKIFHQRFAKQVHVSEQIADEIEDLLKRAALGQMKMAIKSGLALYGFTKLMAAIEKQTIIAIYHATEASPASTEKLDYKFRTNSEQSGVLEHNGLKKPFNGFKTEELSLAFGQANVIHAGLKAGGATAAMIKATQRLCAYQDNVT